MTKTLNKPEKEKLYYIGFVGWKTTKALQRTENVIEVYKLPLEMVVQLNKLQFSSNSYHYKSLQKQQRLLATFKDSCNVYIINSQIKYKYFYPQGLKKGMVISENEFSLWDFTTMIDFNLPVKIVQKRPDSLPAVSQAPLPENEQAEAKEQESKNPEVIKPETGNLITQYIVPGTRTYVFYPWDTEENIDSDTPYDPSFEHYIDSLFINLSNYSEYLGAQRIKLELFDQPFAATFYANMYIHWVDSVVSILKQNPEIKPGEYENFILYTSEIITKRFKYGANILLWQGIRRDRLDCDNTAYLVYDIGKKLGFEVSVVFLWHHALVVVGDYAYETTSREYFPKEELKEHYSSVFLITSDPRKIHAFLSTYEISSDLELKNENLKAEVFKKIGPKYFPGLKKIF